MTDFSPLDSALYESTPEKIAASLRYLRKADAVMAALMPLSASTQAPPAAVPADQEPITAGPGNYYGSLEIRCKDGVPEWCVENYSGCRWNPCPRPVYDALLAAANKENGNG